MGAVFGALIGVLQLLIFKSDAAYVWAAAAAGATYMSMLAVLGRRFRLAAGMMPLGALSGFIAAIVWWTIAVHTTDSFVLAAVAGVCFGSVYVWSEARAKP